MDYTVVKTVTETTRYLLEERQVFSRSVLWDWQRQYYSERSIGAWQSAEVPHYVTTNPSVADTYAEIVFAAKRDAARLRPGAGPLTICELGGGSGRLAFHFLTRLQHLCRAAGMEPSAFRYILSDFAQSNLDAWRAHPRFLPFFESGLLETALFDIEHSEQLVLQGSGEIIAAGASEGPLIVLANYVFDTIPQDLFYLEAGQCRPCLVTLTLDESPEGMDAAARMQRVSCRYDQGEPVDPFGDEPDLHQLMECYRERLSMTHLLFPAVGLRCLRRLRSLSRTGLVVLTADKGSHRLEALRGQEAPGLVRHGSFSLNVNYHAFWAFCEQTGGKALFPRERYAGLNTACLLLLDRPDEWRETLLAFRRRMGDFSLDDFYQIARHAQKAPEAMMFAEIIAYTRLSRHDSDLFARYLPRLRQLALHLSADERSVLTETMAEVWAGHYSLGETMDLAWHFGALAFDLADFSRALSFFEQSLREYGAHAGTIYNIALCQGRLGKREEAIARLHEALLLDPHHALSNGLLAEYRLSGQILPSMPLK